MRTFTREDVEDTIAEALSHADDYTAHLLRASEAVTTLKRPKGMENGFRVGVAPVAVLLDLRKPGKMKAAEPVKFTFESFALTRATGYEVLN